MIPGTNPEPVHSHVMLLMVTSSAIQPKQTHRAGLKATPVFTANITFAQVQYKEIVHSRKKHCISATPTVLFALIKS